MGGKIQAFTDLYAWKEGHKLINGLIKGTKSRNT
jgi:hypothetical protein